MKKLQFTLLLLLGIFLLFGCKEKWEEPEFGVDEWVPPSGTQDPEHFFTIGTNNVVSRNSILSLHTNNTPPDSIISPRITTPRYLRAVVVSSDEGGNYYKSMVIQDATGGVELQLDMSGLHALYPVGQKIVLVLNGLVIGDYNYLPQVGWIYNETQVGRINSLYFNQYIIRDGLPSLDNLPKILTNKDNDLFSNENLNKLVRLEGVTFEPKAIGEPIAYNHFPTDWKVYVPLPTGHTDTVTVRTSNFARFRSMIIEEREYNLTGILTTYRGNFQFMIRTRDDIEALPTGEVVTFDLTSNPLGAGKWSIESLLGPTQWGFRDNSMMHMGNTVSGHNRPMDDWLISPEITYPDLANGYLRFEHRINLINGYKVPYQIWYTTSNATTFNENDWNLLGTLNTSFPSPSFALSEHFPLSSIGTNTFRIAFRYEALDPDIETYQWSIRKVEIRNR